MSAVLVLSVNTSWNVLNFRQGLIRHLQNLGFEIVVLAPNDDSVPGLLALGCRVIDLAIAAQGTSPLQDIVLAWRYRQLLKQLRPVAYLSWTIKPNIYGSLAAQSLGIPVINNVSGLGATFLAGGWLSRIARSLYQLALFRSSVVFFQNPDDRDLFVTEGLVRPDKTVLLPGSGIDLHYFQVVPRVDPTGRPFRFLLVARMLRDKGVLEYVQAARLLRRQGHQVICQCLGFLDVANPSAISRDEMAEWVAEGVVDYLGTTNDVRPLLAQADCVVLPSYREGTPRTLLEAAAMGRPLIATNVPGCREVVTDGENGYLCAARSADSLALAMSRLAGLTPEAWHVLAEGSRRKVARQFDERLVFAAYDRALAGLKERA